ncbi:MAG: S8 family serine peptidase [Bacteroidetes bacterium]|nr:S8 family serine peptidase [Bacteroidota bacterium]
MRLNPIPLIAGLFFCVNVTAQRSSDSTLQLKSGIIIPSRNVSASTISAINKSATRISGQSFVILQFDALPGEKEKQLLQQSGVQFLNYIPNNTYTVSIHDTLSAGLLLHAKVRSVIQLQPKQKMLPAMSLGLFPSWAVKTPGTVDVWINYPKTLSFETVQNELKQRNFDITSSLYKNYQVLSLRISQQRLMELASLSFIDFIEPAPHEDQPLLFNSRAVSKANVLNQPAALGGRNLHGEGVVVGVGDNADLQYHVDFTGRVINRNAEPGIYAHGIHVAGIVAGGGIKTELYTGYAPKATIVSESFSNIITNAPAYVQDYGMVLTNNSYGAIAGDCSYMGLYDLYSRILDQQAFDLPYVQNVFAASNNGDMTCSPYPQGFNTVLGSYQSAKNTLTVGNIFMDGALNNSSGRGPVRDGRLKPEIVAMGSFVASTWPIDTYSYNTGTSMSAPAVTGALALLYQRYRQLHSGSDPKSGLMKALICNGAYDLGNTGPDYKYGFGWMNVLRSVQMLENNQYVTNTIATGNTNSFNITVPANTAQLKVMLYWHDPAAAVMASQTLVNDLDLEVVTPSASTVLPLVLDTIPSNVNNVAVTGADHINNMEQVVISNPSAGSYTVNVKGTAVPQNSPQEYFVVYDALPISTTITNPVGGEHFKPGAIIYDSINICWDSYGDLTNTFKVQYSIDNGSNWIDINTNTAPGARQQRWFVPNVVTDQALVRITNNTTGAVSTSQAFTIIGVPAVSLASVQCEGYISINWTAVSGATDYEVMRLIGNEMQQVAIVPNTTTSYNFSGLSKDSIYWVTVRARLNGNTGVRADAISRQPNSGTCAGSVSDNDLKLDAFVSPVSGRVATSTQLSSNETLSIRIKNLDDAVVNDFTISYHINGGGWVTQTITGAGLAGGATYTQNFTGLDFSAVGTYVIDAVVTNNSAVDPVSANDTLTTTIKQLANPVITINPGSDFTDDLETGTEQTVTAAQTGLDGLDRYDFSNSTVYGRLRTFINSGLAYSGSKAITMDVTKLYAAGNTNYLVGTFNLGSYDAATDDIRLDFRFKQHSQVSNANNKVWIRGNDTSPWIEAYDLFNNQDDLGIYKLSASIEVSDLLAANGQNFSSSFQVRWGQWGQLMTADNDGGAGYSFDDIHLYRVVNDMQMVSIDAPVKASCSLTSNTIITATLRNSDNSTISSVPVKYRIDGGSVISETIPSIAANSNLQYSFATTANLTASGSHTIEVWVDYVTDTYRNNDTTRLTVVNSPVISSFPYLQDFETDNGGWYSDGKNDTWQYGTPASTKINRAASGSKAWKTSLTGNYLDNELSYLYSPCFDISAMTHPMFSFSVALDLEDCRSSGSLCDGAYLEYSADGITWTRLGMNGSGTNWYTDPDNQLWTIQDYTHWHVATYDLPTGLNQMRLRFVMASDPFVNREGIAVDDIHIYDSTTAIYDGATLGAPVTQTINGGTNWIDFMSGGKVFASVQPNSLSMGSTDAQVYINTGAVRTDNGQYYHDRNITIKPANTSLTDSVTVRFYFLDSEAENLINATGCSNCTKPSTAYELGVSKYTDTDKAYENGTITDNVQGSWLFIPSAIIKKVPFDKGYYFEYKVKDFSEFWLNDGGFSKSLPLPLQLLDFTASKQPNKDVLVKWTTEAEFNVNRFEIEVAKSNNGYTQNQFVKIGQVSSQGNSTHEQAYSFIDLEANKTGVRYYRLKIVDNDGSYTYSAIRPVVFTDELKWQVYPNPSSGIFNLVYQLNAGEMMGVKVFDVNGRLVEQQQLTGNGFVQKIGIDLQKKVYAAGLYMIQADVNERRQTFRIIKQ